MATKTYCDICKKEIRYADSWHIKLERRLHTVNATTIQLHEVCNDCVNKIKEIAITVT